MLRRIQGSVAVSHEHVACRPSGLAKSQLSLARREGLGRGALSGRGKGRRAELGLQNRVERFEPVEAIIHHAGNRLIGKNSVSLPNETTRGRLALGNDKNAAIRVR